MWRAFRRFLCGLVLLALAAPAAFAQGDELVEVKLEKDVKITEFLDLISKSTGRPLLYDPNGQRIRGQSLGAGFTHEIPKDRVFDTFRAILAFYELVLVPIGPRGYEIYLVIDSRSTNNFVKNKAVYVDYKELDRYEDNDGLYISCAIPLTHIENLTTLRTALSTMVSPAGIGRVHEVPGSNSIIIMDFAPTVAAMAKLVRQMDVQPPVLCDSIPPASATTAPARANSGVQPTSLYGIAMTSPGPTLPKSPVSRTTRSEPRWWPRDVGIPARVPARSSTRVGTKSSP